MNFLSWMKSSAAFSEPKTSLGPCLTQTSPVLLMIRDSSSEMYPQANLPCVTGSLISNLDKPVSGGLYVRSTINSHLRTNRLSPNYDHHITG